MSRHVDHIFYINLERITDRKENIEKELAGMSLTAERFPAIETNPGCVGCCKSHRDVLKLAKERKYRNVLVLEDDFMFLVSKEELEKNLEQFFESKIDYDVCFLSYNVIRSEPVSDHPFIQRCLEAQTASGYIVNGLYLDKLISLYEESVPMMEKTLEHWIYMNDIIWKDLQRQDKWYYFTVRLGKQRSGYSNNGFKGEEEFVETQC